jgi:endonuclease YncB( thermonuclease family)
MGNCICCNKLEDNDFDNTPTYTLEGQKFECKVVKVYDGDTIWVAIKVHGKKYKFKCRLYGYDSAEMKPSLKMKDREKEIEKAIEAKEFFEKKIKNKYTEIEVLGYDKYGRLLIKFYFYNVYKGICGTRMITNCVYLNDLMIQSGHGVPYFGGTKEKKEMVDE